VRIDSRTRDGIRYLDLSGQRRQPVYFQRRREVG
jgi:hypothetical protein